MRGVGEKWCRQPGAAVRACGLDRLPDTWSAIEYAAHSRDVTALRVYGVEPAFTGGEPAFPSIGDDALEAAASSYAGEVGAALAAAADRLAQLAADAGIDAWTRGVTVGGTRSDVRQLLEHALHDSQHHLNDVECGPVQITQ